jgi:sugar phosphate isomerase/epimerase
MTKLEPADSDNAGKLGFRLSGFRFWPVIQALQVLSEIGYHSVELCLEHPELDPLTLTKSKIAEIRQSLDYTGLSVSAVSYHGKRDDLNTTLAKQKRGLELTLEFGTHVFVAGTGLKASDPQGKDTNTALEELVRVAEGMGCIVAVEPEPDTVLHSMKEFSLLVDRLAGAPVGLNLDIGHAALTENDVSDSIREWGTFIRHVHLEDIRKPHHIHLLPGEGELALLGISKELRRVGYNGDLTIDLFDILEAPDQWARQALERCRKLKL